MGETANLFYVQITRGGGERKICTDVCYPRLEKAINGYDRQTDRNVEHVDGLGGGVRYFTMPMVDSSNTDYNKKQIIRCITSILCMRDNCFDVISKGANHVLFKNNSGKKQMGILYDDKGADALKGAIRKHGTRTSVYVFSLDSGVGGYDFDDINGLVVLKPTPQDILEMYKVVCARKRGKK